MQEAINTIADIMSCYPQIDKISVSGATKVSLILKSTPNTTLTFTSALKLLEWCERNFSCKTV